MKQYLRLGLLTWVAVSHLQAQGDAPLARPSRFRVRSDLVRLNVSVVDRQNRPFVGLAKEDIQLFEDKVEQEIAYFIPDQSPVVTALVLDASGSMGRDFKMDRARAATLHFVETSHPQDEVSLITFNQRVSRNLDFTSNRNRLAGALETVSARGQTALYDAVYLALDTLNRHPTERRKVILLITDGADTRSVYSLGDVRGLARESDVQIYAVGILGQDMSWDAVRALQDLAEMTGGLSFFPSDPGEMEDICQGIAVELHRQYLVAYRSSNPRHAGEWRKIRLKIRKRKGRPHLIVRTRRGYYERQG